MRLFLMSFLFAFSAHAKVQVAFIVLKDVNGHVVQFEEGGRFGHVAVSYKGQWLQAHPVRGVELVKTLNDLGWTAEILESEHFNEPSDEYVAQNLGKPFSYLKPWEDAEYTYCAKLLAAAYDIQPGQMSFSTPMWQGRAELPVGKEGLSPDDLYKEFLSRGFSVKYKYKDSAPTQTQIRMIQAK